MKQNRKKNARNNLTTNASLRTPLICGTLEHLPSSKDKSQCGKRKRKGPKRSFDYDATVTQLHHAITRDLGSEFLEPGLDFYRTCQISDFTKKYVGPGHDTTYLEDVTYDKFMGVNRYMKRFISQHVPSESTIQSSSPFRDKVLIRARALVHKVLGEVDHDEWFSYCKHGTGSSIGVPFVDTEIERKFLFPLSTTESVIPLFDLYRSSDSLLDDLVTKHNQSDPSGLTYSVVKGSRATTVDKTTKIRRMIAIEPTLNMFFQQGLMHVMYRRMKSHGINVETLPEFHVEEARKASITGLHATIDFSSASDCVSGALVDYLFPKGWVRKLNLVRSPSMSIQGCDVELSMFSTMGNATTFPIETLVFWSIANATVFTLDNPQTNSVIGMKYSYTHSRKEAMRKDKEIYPCSVFGDDCIIPTRAAISFMQVCEGCGFIPNQEKSHYDASDPFRESCGGDFLRGFPVRAHKVRPPVSEKKSSFEPWAYTLINSLLPKYILYFGSVNYVYQLGFLDVLFKLFRDNDLLIKVVPSDFPSDAGIHDNGDLHRILRDKNQLKLVRIEDGRHVFNFCRFVYRAPKSPKSDDLRYWSRLCQFNTGRAEPHDWFTLDRFDYLDNPKFINDDDFYRKRKKGGYVVGKAETVFWTVPTWLIDHESANND